MPKYEERNAGANMGSSATMSHAKRITDAMPTFREEYV
jgi:hypothetical protein